MNIRIFDTYLHHKILLSIINFHYRLQTKKKYHKLSLYLKMTEILKATIPKSSTKINETRNHWFT